MRRARRLTHFVIAPALLAGVLLASPLALAGDLKIGTEPLAVDGKGNLTKEGKAAAVDTIEARPGDDSWAFSLWARIDNAAVGPLYLEFFRNKDGRHLRIQQIEVPDFGGDKYISMDVELWRTDGFRPDETIEVQFLQNVGGRDAVRAKTNLTLAKSSEAPPEPEPEPESEPEDWEKEDEEAKGEAEAPAPEPTAPPPVAPETKKGCTVGSRSNVAWWTLLALVAAPGLRRRARRSGPV